MTETISPKLPTQLEKAAGAALARIQLESDSLPLFFAVFSQFPDERTCLEHLASLQAVATFKKNCLFFRGHGLRVIGVYPTSHVLAEHEQMVKAIMKQHQEFAQADAQVRRSGSMRRTQ